MYLLQPEGYEKHREDTRLVWKLNKSLYGLKQSGRNWNIVLNEFFQENDFTQSEVDACLYFKKSESVLIFIVVWVDDIVVAANTNKLINQTKDLLKKNESAKGQLVLKKTITAQRNYPKSNCKE